MKSILFQPSNPFRGAEPCAPCRTEETFTIHKNGYIYTFVMRDKLIPEDPYIVLIKAAAFSIQYASPYPGGEPPRAVRDFLIKGAVAAL